ncbi:hypothetical protein HPB50_001767 [Hyalomma asiaticum]|uniref:Uncharacterized protein n=1 Tax=Hyalomma asiaticum TaxID=266040 RepID=A0ACB7T7T2_HYAAI|nr:hypothetical protein HPB50_001767 [Hyalomma asiaticum]
MPPHICGREAFVIQRYRNNRDERSEVHGVRRRFDGDCRGYSLPASHDRKATGERGDDLAGNIVSDVACATLDARAGIHREAPRLAFLERRRLDCSTRRNKYHARKPHARNEISGRLVIATSGNQPPAVVLRVSQSDALSHCRSRDVPENWPLPIEQGRTTDSIP